MPPGRPLIRPVAAADVPALLALARRLDTVNLPADEAAVRRLVERSLGSFAALVAAGGPPAPSARAQYTLVAEVDGAVRGTASLFAYHGLPDDPHYYLKVERAQAVSQQLQATRDRTILRLGRDVEPWTELGGLVVDPEARGTGLGKLLVAARLLLVAMHPAAFCRRLLAELLPPLRPAPADPAAPAPGGAPAAGSGNAFWDAVGAPLTGLDYYRADLLCRSDKAFIDEYFPHTELVAELLPQAARDLIGHEGPATTPVRAVLHRAGFRWLGTIDPFDAGPHDGAPIEAVPPIVRSRPLVRLDLPPAPGAAEPPALFAAQVPGPDGGHRFLALRAQVAGHGIRLGTEDAATLGAAPGERLWRMPLDW